MKPLDEPMGASEWAEKHAQLIQRGFTHSQIVQMIGSAHSAVITRRDIIYGNGVGIKGVMQFDREMPRAS